MKHRNITLGNMTSVVLTGASLEATEGGPAAVQERLRDVGGDGVAYVGRPRYPHHPGDLPGAVVVQRAARGHPWPPPLQDVACCMASPARDLLAPVLHRPRGVRVHEPAVPQGVRRVPGQNPPSPQLPPDLARRQQIRAEERTEGRLQHQPSVNLEEKHGHSPEILIRNRIKNLRG